MPWVWERPVAVPFLLVENEYHRRRLVRGPGPGVGVAVRAAEGAAAEGAAADGAVAEEIAAEEAAAERIVAEGTAGGAGAVTCTTGAGSAVGAGL